MRLIFYCFSLVVFSSYVMHSGESDCLSFKKRLKYMNESPSARVKKLFLLGSTLFSFIVRPLYKKYLNQDNYPLMFNLAPVLAPCILFISFFGYDSWQIKKLKGITDDQLLLNSIREPWYFMALSRDRRRLILDNSLIHEIDPEILLIFIGLDDEEEKKFYFQSTRYLVSRFLNEPFLRLLLDPSRVKMSLLVPFIIHFPRVARAILQFFVLESDKIAFLRQMLIHNSNQTALVIFANQPRLSLLETETRGLINLASYIIGDPMRSDFLNFCKLLKQCRHITGSIRYFPVESHEKGIG